MQYRLPDLVIPVDSDVSNALTRRNLQHADGGLTIQPPSALDAQAFNVEISMVDGADATDDDYAVLQSGGEDVVLEADKALVLTHVHFNGLRIKMAAGTAAQQRTFLVGARDDND